MTQQRTRRVVREVHDDHPGAAREGTQVVDVEVKAVRAVGERARAPRDHVAAERARKLEERLVRRHGDDDAIARVEERRHREEEALGGRAREHVRVAHAVVERRDLGAQQRVAAGVDVAEPELPPLRAQRLVRAVHDVLQGEGVAVARGQERTRLELARREPAFEGERRRLHGAS